MKEPIIYKKRGRVWYFRRAGELTFHSTESTTKAARAIFIDKLKEKEAEDAKKAPGMTLESFAAGFFRQASPWIKRQHAKGRAFSKAQAQNRQNHLDRYILPRFGKTELSEITKPDIEDWLVGLDLANATRNHVMYTLRIVLREGKARKLIAENPLQEPEPLGKTSKTRDVFSAAELTGARLEHCTVQGEAVAVRITGKGNKERVVRIKATLFDEICTEFHGSTYLFETAGGLPFNRVYVSTRIHKLALRVLGRRLGAHSLRHSFATRQ